MNMDSSVVYTVQSIGPSWYPVAWFVSNVVSSAVVSIGLVVAVLLISGKRKAAAELLIVSVLSLAVVFLLKQAFEGPRPYWVDPNVVVYERESGYGAPSAHAFVSLVVIGWLLLKHKKSAFLAVSAVLLILLIGLSRIYLGVHYPSQILFGWACGMLLLFVLDYFDKKGMFSVLERLDKTD